MGNSSLSSCKPTFPRSGGRCQPREVSGSGAGCIEQLPSSLLRAGDCLAGSHSSRASSQSNMAAFERRRTTASPERGGGGMHFRCQWRSTWSCTCTWVKLPADGWTGPDVIWVVLEAQGFPWWSKQQLGFCGISWLPSPHKSSGAPSASSLLWPGWGSPWGWRSSGILSGWATAAAGVPAALNCLALGQWAFKNSLGDGSKEEHPQIWCSQRKLQFLAITNFYKEGRNWSSH